MFWSLTFNFALLALCPPHTCIYAVKTFYELLVISIYIFLTAKFPARKINYLQKLLYWFVYFGAFTDAQHYLQWRCHTCNTPWFFSMKQDLFTSSESALMIQPADGWNDWTHTNRILISGSDPLLSVTLTQSQFDFFHLRLFWMSRNPVKPAGLLSVEQLQSDVIIVTSDDQFAAFAVISGSHDSLCVTTRGKTHWI